MADQDKEREPIKITDRRSFTAAGERREGTRPDESVAESATIQGAGFELRRESAPKTSKTDPEVDFNSFVLSLASTAFIHLGEVEDPVTHKKETNPLAARQIIDIIDMLYAKTRGNLEPGEEQFVQEILYELKMKFAQNASSS